MSEWQPARIAGSEHVLRFHKIDPLATSRFAGALIRVRRSDEAHKQLHSELKLWLGCDSEYTVEVHPEDAHKLWPDVDGNIGLCEHQILTD